MKKLMPLIFSLAVLPLFAAAPAVPKAPVITYGLVRDEYGVPLGKDAAAQASLVKATDADGKLYARCAVAPNAFLGLNYRLSLEIDSKGPVRSRAVTVGTPMRVTVAMDGSDQQLAPSPVWVTPEAGTAQRRDYTLGEDTDGDGLPDEWEYWMMELNPRWGEPGQPTTLASFRPDGDLDGDGMTNLQEFYAGTDPFQASDLFSIVSFERVLGTNSIAIRFRTAVDRSYHVVMAETPGAAMWAPVATAKSADGDYGYTVYPGTGRMMTVYVDASLEKAFFKIACN